MSVPRSIREAIHKVTQKGVSNIMATQSTTTNNVDSTVNGNLPEGNTASVDAPIVPNVPKPVINRNAGFVPAKVLTLSDLAGINENVNKAASVAVKARSESDVLGFKDSVSVFNEHGTLTLFRKEGLNVPFFSYRTGIQEWETSKEVTKETKNDKGETVTEKVTETQTDWAEGVNNILADTMNSAFSVIAYRIGDDGKGFSPNLEEPFVHVQSFKIGAKVSAHDQAVKAYNSVQAKVRGKNPVSGYYVAVIVQALDNGSVITYRSSRFKLVVK